MSNDSRMAPKVHPLEREAAPEDPWTLHAEPVAGDPEVMLDCLVQEFVALGWDRERLLHLFAHPGYPVLNELLALFGPEHVRSRVEMFLGPVDGLRFRVVESDDVEDLDDVEGIETAGDSGLVPLSLDRLGRAGTEE